LGVDNQPGFVWAPGDLPFELPLNMGFPLGPADFGYQSFSLEIHYDNPESIENVVDNSGVRVYYVNTMRPIQAGMLEVGDPDVLLADQPVGGGITEDAFECGSGCSALALPSTGVTVMRSYFHMHKTGIQASNEIIRNGTVVNTASVEFFDFAQQGNQPVQAEPFTILPGDAFRVRCRYRNTPNDTSVIFGLESSNEMCVAFFLYYPRQTIEEFQFPWYCAYQFVDPCSTEHSSRELEDTEELGRSFGSPMTQAATPDSFNNSLMCPLIVSPPPDGVSPPSNEDDVGASSSMSPTTPVAVIGSAIIGVVLLSLYTIFEI
jgi:Copper type II ascorbate-dependent monooxygenase, C-terminal domain/Copper type II ascorbate-dependent monooxygenase, N-terminal domain